MINSIIDALREKRYQKIFRDNNNDLVNRSTNLLNSLLESLNEDSLKQHLLEKNQDKVKFNFNLETYMAALPVKYLICYIFAACMNLFHPLRAMTMIYDQRTHFDYDCIYVIKRIKSILNYHQDVYYIKVNKLNVYLPWNDYIIPILAREVFQNETNPYKKLNHRTLDTYFTDDVRQLVTKLVQKDQGFLTWLCQNSHQNFDHFVNHTQRISIAINGTACVGKSSLLLELAGELSSFYNTQCQVQKIGKYGGYRGKDNNQVLSLSYQAVMMNLTNRDVNNLHDRDAFNNLIWRCILQYPDNDEKDLVELVTEIFVKSISKNLIKTMSQYPVIVLIDLNAVANRERMYLRNTGNDRVRCFIKNYVESQNVFYALFAYMCRWPIFNTAYDPTDRSTIKKLVFEKYHNNVTNNISDAVPLNYNVTFKTDYVENFERACKLNIMK